MTENYLKIVRVDSQNRNFPFVWQQNVPVDSLYWQRKNESISELKFQLGFHSANILNFSSMPLKQKVFKLTQQFICGEKKEKRKHLHLNPKD